MIKSRYFKVLVDQIKTQVNEVCIDATSGDSYDRINLLWGKINIYSELIEDDIIEICRNSDDYDPIRLSKLVYVGSDRANFLYGFSYLKPFVYEINITTGEVKRALVFWSKEPHCPYVEQPIVAMCADVNLDGQLHFISKPGGPAESGGYVNCTLDLHSLEQFDPDGDLEPTSYNNTYSISIDSAYLLVNYELSGRPTCPPPSNKINDFISVLSGKYILFEDLSTPNLVFLGKSFWSNCYEGRQIMYYVPLPLERVKKWTRKDFDSGLLTKFTFLPEYAWIETKEDNGSIECLRSRPPLYYPGNVRINNYTTLGEGAPGSGACICVYGAGYFFVDNLGEPIEQNCNDCSGDIYNGDPMSQFTFCGYVDLPSEDGNLRYDYHGLCDDQFNYRSYYDQSFPADKWKAIDDGVPFLNGECVGWEDLYYQYPRFALFDSGSSDQVGLIVKVKGNFVVDAGQLKQVSLGDGNFEWRQSTEPELEYYNGVVMIMAHRLGLYNADTGADIGTEIGQSLVTGLTWKFSNRLSGEEVGTYMHKLTQPSAFDNEEDFRDSAVCVAETPITLTGQNFDKSIPIIHYKKSLEGTYHWAIYFWDFYQDAGVHGDPDHLVNAREDSILAFGDNTNSLLLGRAVERSLLPRSIVVNASTVKAFVLLLNGLSVYDITADDLAELFELTGFSSFTFYRSATWAISEYYPDYWYDILGSTESVIRAAIDLSYGYSYGSYACHAAPWEADDLYLLNGNSPFVGDKRLTSQMKKTFIL